MNLDSNEIIGLGILAVIIGGMLFITYTLESFQDSDQKNKRS